MRRTGTQLIRLEASEGMVLTDGETYTTLVYVGTRKAAAKWREVREEDVPDEQDDVQSD